MHGAGRFGFQLLLAEGQATPVLRWTLPCHSGDMAQPLAKTWGSLHCSPGQSAAYSTAATYVLDCETNPQGFAISWGQVQQVVLGHVHLSPFLWDQPVYPCWFRLPGRARLAWRTETLSWYPGFSIVSKVACDSMPQRFVHFLVFWWQSKLGLLQLHSEYHAWRVPAPNCSKAARAVQNSTWQTCDVENRKQGISPQEILEAIQTKHNQAGPQPGWQEWSGCKHHRMDCV